LKISGFKDCDTTGSVITSNPLSFKTLLLSFTNLSSGLKCCADSRAMILSKNLVENGIEEEVQLTRSICLSLVEDSVNGHALF